MARRALIAAAVLAALVAALLVAWGLASWRENVGDRVNLVDEPRVVARARAGELARDLHGQLERLLAREDERRIACELALCLRWFEHDQLNGGLLRALRSSLCQKYAAVVGAAQPLAERKSSVHQTTFP